MVKRCQWGLCNSDSRYSERLVGGIEFHPFPKPKQQLERCRRWIKACGRPQTQLNVDKIDGNYALYVCSKHFHDGKPTETYPDPEPAVGTHSSVKTTPKRPPPKHRSFSEKPKKRKQVLAEDSDLTGSNKENTDGRVDVQTTGPLESFCQEPGISPLHMLALAAENDELKAKLAQEILTNESLRRENSKLKKEICELKKNRNVICRPAITMESIRDSEIKDNFKYYTGFIFSQFMNIFTFLVPNERQCPFELSKKMTRAKSMRLCDQFLMVLMKLRLNLEFIHLANLFCMSPSDAGLLFRNWMNYMFFRFGSVPIWPHRDTIIDNMPQKFRKDFPTTLVILDGTELKIERPSSLRSQSQCYSDYKSATTLKGLVGIDPKGSFIFISTLFAGSISDKEITKQSGLLELLSDLIDQEKVKIGDCVMVDKGFRIDNEIDSLGLKLLIPPNASSTSQMSPGDVALTCKIAKHRVHVERAISRVKKFKIVDNRIDLSLFPVVNHIWFNCCFLTQFMPMLIQDE